MKVPSFSRNRMIGFILGKYELEKESKKLLHTEEQYISGTEIVKYNESIYIIAILFSIITFLLILYDLLFVFLVIVIPILIIFSNELEIYILTNDRIVVIKRTILEKIFKIQNETSVPIDQVAIVTYSRAPINKNAFYACLIAILSLLILYPLIQYYEIPDILYYIIFVSTLLLILYLIWFGLRLNRKSLELSIVGVNSPFGLGRSKGIPIWFVFDIQNLVFGKSRLEYSPPEIKSKVPSDTIEEQPVDITIILDATPLELHKNILRVLHKQSMTEKQVRSLLNTYSKSEFKKGFKQLRKKRFIYFNSKTDTWDINKAVKIMKSDLG